MCQVLCQVLQRQRPMFCALQKFILHLVKCIFSLFFTPVGLSDTRREKMTESTSVWWLVLFSTKGLLFFLKSPLFHMFYISPARYLLTKWRNIWTGRGLGALGLSKAQLWKHSSESWSVLAPSWLDVTILQCMLTSAAFSSLHACWIFCFPVLAHFSPYWPGDVLFAIPYPTQMSPLYEIFPGHS